MTKKAVVAALAALLAGAGAAANDGSSEAKAVVITAKGVEQTRDFTLHSNGTNNIFYFKMSLAKKKPYTIWLTNRKSPEPGATPQIAIAETYPVSSFSIDFSKNPPSADFEYVTAGNYTWWVMTGRNWEKENDKWDDQTGDDIKFNVPGTWSYYIVVRGAPGESATLHYCMANALPLGIYQNPLVIEPKTAEAGTTKEELKFHTPFYFLQTDFEIGRRYYFATGGGVEGNAFTMCNFPAGQTRAYPDWATDEYNDSRIFIPDASGTAIFSIGTSEQEDDEYGLASLRYRVDPVRTIAQHPATVLTADVPAAFAPGHLNAWDSGAYDAIIDEALFKFTAAKSQRYIIQATWDDPSRSTNMLMRVYDAKGNVLAQNRGDGSGLNTRCAIDAQKAKTVFYVGVCEDLGERDDFDPPQYWPAHIVVTPVADVAAEAVTLHPAVAAAAIRPLEADPEGEAIGGFSSDCWYRTVCINARAGMKYDLYPSSEVADAAFSLTAVLYTGSGKKEKVIDTFDFTPGVGDVAFTAMSTEPHYLRISVTDGLGLDFPEVTVHSVGYSASGVAGGLRVAPKGAPTATWKLKGEKVSYNVGDSILLPVNKDSKVATYTVQYGAVKGYNAPAACTVTVTGGEETLVDDGRYTDTYDPKDDYTSGKSGKIKYAATGWTLKTSETVQRHTLWENDAADNFTFTTKDGYYLDFYFTERSCDAVFTIFDAQGAVVRDEFGGAVEAKDEVRHLALKAGKYVLRVTHGTPETVGGSYALAGLYANVGAIKFAKAAVSVKDNATTLNLTVNRTAKTGSVRVRYETIDGTATAGGQFYATSGFLEWGVNDNKAKTVTIRMIPKLGAWYDGGNKKFLVKLADAHEADDYTAQITLDTCTVTVTETSKASVTQESVYAKKAAKVATVKKSENVSIETGTFTGVLREKTGALTNGLPEFASVTLTSTAATTKKAAALTAKVLLGGKTYTFKASDGWDDMQNGVYGMVYVKTLRLIQKVNKIPYTNECMVVLRTGEMTSNAWIRAIGRVKLSMNVPDANGKGVQTGVEYDGDAIIRKNEKVQGYLDEVVKFAGYYTVALPALDTKATDRGTPDAGTPEGNGYVTMTISNKGAVKLAGLLPDGTKISSSTVAALVPDDQSPLGYALYVPVYQAKSPYVFAGQLWLKAVESDPALHPDGRAYDVVVSADPSESFLVWNNDNGKLTYDGRQGWRKTLEPVGGWFDTVFNLQSYYRDAAYAVETAGEFPKEALPSGYVYVETANTCPSNTPALLAGDAFSLAKKAMVKAGKLYDFDACVNPCNVQIKLARATGVVTGSFSLWSETADGLKQKEVTGFKHYGVVLLQRDAEAAALSPDALSAGYVLKSMKVSDVNAKGKPVTRNWAFSAPFNVIEE